MATIVNGGRQAYSAIAFGLPNTNTVSFLQNQFTSMSSVMSEAGRSFMERGRELFDKYHGAEAMRLAKAAIRATQHMFMHDAIMELNNISQFQQAKPVMQRWIMACPDIRKLYHQQRCDGYSGSYIDMYPGTIGEDHYDYRKVMSGIMVVGETDDCDYDWRMRVWIEDDENDVTLSFGDKTTILSVWDMVKSMAKPGKEDPTDPLCGTL